MSRQRRITHSSSITLLVAGLALLVLWTSASPAAAFAPQLRRAPYLTDATAGGATVNWATDRSLTSGSVQWGPPGACSTNTVAATRAPITVNGVPEYTFKTRLAIPDDTAFCYRVLGGTTDLLGAATASPTATTQLPTGSTTPFSFAVLGDWGLGLAAGNPGQAGVIRQIAASGARFAVMTGDTAYPAGTPTNYGDLRQTGDNISGVFGPQGWPVAGASIPMFPITGNHGFNSTFLSTWPTTQTAATSGGKFAAETYCCTNGTRSAGYPSAWYAFDQGPVRVYALSASWADTNIGTADSYKNDFDNHWTTTSPEYTWLQQDLAAHPGQVKMAFWHYPLAVDNASEKSDPYLAGGGSLQGLLERFGVVLGFNGHAHVYQRNRPTPGGLVTYVAGGGGAKLQPVSHCTATDAYAIGWSSTGGSACGAAPKPTSAAQVYSFVLVRVAGNQVTVTPTDSTGRTFDVQTYTVPTATPPPPPPAGGIALVRSASASTASGTSMSVPITTTAGNALVASVALGAGSTSAVSGITDSAGGSWTKGPVGFLAGSSTRTELWYRTGAPAVGSVTVTLTTAKAAAVTVSEFSGIAATGALDASAATSSASSTTAATPPITTTNATDLVVGAINYAGSGTSTLSAPGFTSLPDASAPTVNGRAAYVVTTAAGSWTAGWTLSRAAGSGGVILALKGA
ncbi:MAG: metallophosphoesterase [Conexibacter sp.]|nr:metallophosphoesterase [Conexibacter sp.]